MAIIFLDSPCRVKLNNVELAGWFLFDSIEKGSNCIGFIGKDEDNKVVKVSFGKTEVSDTDLETKVKALSFDDVPKLKKKE